MVTEFKTLNIIFSSLMHAIYYHPVTANLFEPLWPIIIYIYKNNSSMLCWATLYNLNKISVWGTQSELWAYV
jgi:hypothetical protein